MTAGILIIAAALAAAVLAGLARGRGSRRDTGRNRPVRIDHPHYMTEDESECSACGARFLSKHSVCPRCGARFTGAVPDEDEWYEEFDEECDMDEEENGR